MKFDIDKTLLVASELKCDDFRRNAVSDEKYKVRQGEGILPQLMSAYNEGFKAGVQLHKELAMLQSEEMEVA